MSTRPSFSARLVALAMLTPVLALAGCSSSAAIGPAAATVPSGAATEIPAATPPTVVPAVADVPSPDRQLAVGCDAFERQPKGSADASLKSGEVLAVTLCANGSTGFSWAPPVIVGNAIVVSGSPTGMPGPDASSPAVGAATTTTFLLKAAHGGNATVTFSYSRPWSGGEKDVWMYTVRATVD